MAHYGVSWQQSCLFNLPSPAAKNKQQGMANIVRRDGGKLDSDYTFIILMRSSSAATLASLS